MWILIRWLHQKPADLDHVPIQKVLSERGLTLTFFLFIFFFFWGGGVGGARGERIQIPLKDGHYRLASKTPFQWHFPGGPVIAQH